MKSFDIDSLFMQMNLHSGLKRKHHEQELQCNYESETGFNDIINALKDDESDNQSEE